jgi:hypothetical protein
MRPVSDSQIELLNRLSIQLGVPTPMPKDYDSARDAITRLQGMRR